MSDRASTRRKGGPRLVGRSLLLALLLVLGSTVLRAQDSLGTIRGIVVSDSSHAPLEFVNVFLLSGEDTTLVMGSSTDAAGKFAFKNVPMGIYAIRFAIVGSAIKTISRLVLEPARHHLNLGTIVLASTTLNLDEVTVTAERAPITSSIDRLVYNVDLDLVNKAASASDLLENIPSVQVDLNGEVSLRGSQRVLLMINGKRSPILERQEGNFLEQLPANAIEKIEVITTPSARYRAQGKSGIINIIMKKDTPLGTNGYLTANAGTKERYGANLRVNHSPGSFNLYGSYSTRKDNRDRVNEDVREEATGTNATTISSVYTDNIHSFYHPVSQIATLGFDCRVDSMNSFGISGSYLRNSYPRNDSSYRLLKSVAGFTLSEYNRIGGGEELDEEYGVALNYHHTFFRPDHKVRIEAGASRSPETDVYTFRNSYLSPVFPDARQNSLISLRDDRSHIAVDYSNVLSKATTIEAGYIDEFNSTDMNFSAENYDLILQQFLPDTVKSSRYTHSETIHSLYTTVKQSFGKFSMLLGARFERASETSELRTLDSTVNATYWNIFPSAHFAYALSRSTDLKLSYGRRISRPDARDLNPFPEFRDPKNISYGNPLILPEYIHSIELGVQYQGNHIFLHPSLFYRYSSNDIHPIKRFVNRSTLQTTRENVSSDLSAGIEVIASWRTGDLLSLHMSTTGVYDELDASNVSSGKLKSNLAWTGTFTANIGLAEQTKLELRSHWNTLRVTAQGEHFPSFSLGFGARQGFLDGKLTISCTGSDLLKTVKRRDDLDILRLQQSVVNTRDTQIFTLGFTYRLGTTPKKSKAEQYQYEDED